MKDNFIWIALCLAALLLILPYLTGIQVTEQQQGMPLLLALLMCEFGAVLCVIGVWNGINKIKQSGVLANMVGAIVVLIGLAAALLWRLVELYPQ